MEERKKWIMLGIVMTTVLVIQLLPERGLYVDNDWIQTQGSREDDDAFSESDLDATEAILMQSKKDQSLMKKIVEGAKERSHPASDARIDSVWKAIPPYNGLVVNIEETYKASLNDTNEIIWVYEEQQPEILLEDLGAQPIYRGNPNKPMVSIMINVAWGNEYIPSILDTLEQENVHATFFLDGSWLSKNKEMAKQILDAGHELSNHAYSHKDMGNLSRSEAEREIRRTEELLQEMGVRNQLFAPPSGHYDEETVKIAREQGLYTILWTLDTVDWKDPEPEWIVHKISTRVEAGSLILMHPTESSSKALPEMIRQIKKKGLSISTVSDLLSPKRVDSVEMPVLF